MEAADATVIVARNYVSTGADTAIENVITAAPQVFVQSDGEAPIAVPSQAMNPSLGGEDATGLVMLVTVGQPTVARLPS